MIIKVDNRARKITKLVKGNMKDEDPKSACRNFAPKFQKGLTYEFPMQIDFITKAIKETKEECKLSISDCIGIIAALHYDMEKMS